MGKNKENMGIETINQSGDNNKIENNQKFNKSYFYNHGGCW